SGFTNPRPNPQLDAGEYGRPFAAERPAVLSPDGQRKAPTMPSSSAKRMIVAGLGIVLVAGAGTWMAAARDTGARRMPATTQARSVEAAAPVAAASTGELAEFRVDQAGVALSFPTAWVRVTAANP